MGVTPTELAGRYPRLYHMADGGSWDGIKRHGLLSTLSLVERFEVSPELRRQILEFQRKRSFRIEHPVHGRAVVRDQKPLNRSKLEGCLQGCSFADWLRMLNSRVFFWLTEERLRTLMCAGEYCGSQHVVLILDTKKLAEDYEERITLAPMNTGNTRPFAHPRGLKTFSRMAAYPYHERLHRGLHYTVVELAVERGVPNVLDYATEVAEMRCSTCDKRQNQGLAKIRRLFP